MKYRLYFSKTGLVCFIGHLDLLKIFQRAIKRTGIPISYSRGFNPHQKMSFALPLSLGMEGFSEILDIELDRKVSINDILQINNFLPNGIFINNVIEVDMTSKAAALVSRARYRAYFDEDIPIAEIVDNMLEMDTIISCERDIKQDIFMMQATNNMLRMEISAGSRRNLKPLLVTAFIYETANIKDNPFIQIAREELILD